MEEIPFNMSARTANLLGRENVVNHYSALIELVKNAFDADAKKCIIFSDYQNDCMWLIDNGDGMTRKIIKEQWMIIGTDNKCEYPISPNGRIKAGAKGIGRFALDRLGKKCTMYTRSLGDDCLVWDVDWEQFSKPNTVLTDIKASLAKITSYDSIREQMALGNDFDEHVLPCLNEKGTLFCIQGLRDPWKGRLAETQGQLETIRCPESNRKFEIYALDSESRNQADAFSEHKLDIPSFDDFDYKLQANYSNGNFDITIERNETDPRFVNNAFFKQLKKNKYPYDQKGFSTKKYNLNRSLQTLVPNLTEIEIGYILNNLGKIQVSLYYLKLRRGVSPEIYKYRKFNPISRRNWLDSYGGIKIYRDDFKVRPYGEGDSKDWLYLSARRARNPAALTRKGGGRLTADQLTGTLQISRLDSSVLSDVASREGLQSSPLFDLLKRIMIGLITLIERDRHYAAVALEKIHKEEKKKKTGNTDEKAKDVINKAKKDSSSLSKDDVSVLDEALKAHDEERLRLAGELSLLRGLAGIGAVTSSFAHDLRGLENKVSNFMLMTKNKLAKLLNEYNIDSSLSKDTIQYLDIIEEKHEEINNWILFITGTIRRDKRERKHVAPKQYFSKFLEMWKPLLSDKQIACNINYSNFLEGKIRAFKIDLDSIFNNLFLNSVDALSKKQGEREIAIQVKEDETHLIFKYSDNGHGLSKKIASPDNILEFGYTTKTNSETGEEGLGLGMYIVDCTISDNNAELSILKPNEGFCLEIRWPKVI